MTRRGLGDRQQMVGPRFSFAGVCAELLDVFAQAQRAMRPETPRRRQLSAIKAVVILGTAIQVDVKAVSKLAISNRRHRLH